jgi:phosphoribosylformimino-5-aminoimidazole carboxamide ribonucleotide (ProFAR) isomerase
MTNEVEMGRRTLSEIKSDLIDLVNEVHQVDDVEDAMIVTVKMADIIDELIVMIEQPIMIGGGMHEDANALLYVNTTIRGWYLSGTITKDETEKQTSM